MKKILHFMIVAAVLVIGFFLSGSHFSGNRLRPHAREEIEKAKQR
jgi:hypothetical protein